MCSAVIIREGVPLVMLALNCLYEYAYAYSLLI